MEKKSSELTIHQKLDQIIKEMVELGIFGVTIPEEYGGSASPGEEMVYAMLAVHVIVEHVHRAGAEQRDQRDDHVNRVHADPPAQTRFAPGAPVPIA